MEAIKNLFSQQSIFFFLAINAAVGFFLGLIPLCFGIFRGKRKLGIIGIICATVGGLISGIFLSIPAVVLFTWLIVRSVKPSEELSQQNIDDNH